MKTTPEGLTHLINMLVDVVNLQRKALGTPGATCEVWLDVSDGKATVRLDAVVDAAASPPPVTLEQFGGKGDRMLTLAEITAAEVALVAQGYATGEAKNAVGTVLEALGLPLSADNNQPSAEERSAAMADMMSRAKDF